uniref:Uncharacterized protein n=1 Tax=Tanacetum cinerariifolium TaxID=118510 RepID=A0A699KCR7_TANCI|nr:hypothetical protein [Tanacetum cinerariifolium]
MALHKMDENDPANARKRRKELMSNRKCASSKDKRSNPSVSSDAFLTGLSTSSAHPQPTIRNRMPLSDITNCRVSQMQQQDTNVLTIPLPFGLNISLTLGNSIVPYGLISTIVNGPDQRDLSFPENNFNLELKSNT